jgi:hypothetical protein
MVHIMKRINLRSLAFLLLIAVVAASASARLPAIGPATGQVNSNQQGATRSPSHRDDNRSAKVTSSDRRTAAVIACKQSCEVRYDNCVAAWVAKGRDRERGETRCGVSARSCKARCDRNR